MWWHPDWSFGPFSCFTEVQQVCSQPHETCDRVNLPETLPQKVLSRSSALASTAASSRSSSPGSRGPAPQSRPRVSEKPVVLHIYDVTQVKPVWWLNSVLANTKSPLKLCGMFHVGVEVDGVEWSFGHSEEETGVTWNRPRQKDGHCFRQSVEMGVTDLTLSEFAHVLRSMKKEYSGHDYNLLRRNCCHFADDMCQRLKVGEIPSYLHRLSKIGDVLSKCSEAVQDIASKTRLSLNNAQQPGSKSYQDTRNYTMAASTEDVERL